MSRVGVTPTDQVTEATAPVVGISPQVQALRAVYWRRVRWATGVPLAFWLLVTLAVPWFARELNEWHIGRFPLGFWLNSQGAIGLFVVLIAGYAWVMDRLDADFLHGLVDLENRAVEALSRRGP